MKTSAKRVSAAFKKYWAISKINFANQLTYSVDMLSEVMFLMFIFSILFFLHSQTVKITPTSPVETLSLVQIMWIIFLTTLVAGERTRGVAHTLNEEILSGQIAYQLNRPYSYIIFHLVQHVATKIPALLFGGVINGIYVYWLVGFPSLSFGSFVLGLLMLCIGMVINFFIQFCIGLCAFWVGNVDPIRWIYLQVMIVAGGMAVPLALLPVAIKKVILLLPFSTVAYGASRVIVGCPRADLFFYVGMQLFWLIMLLIITKAFFKAGVKHVVISGG